MFPFLLQVHYPSDPQQPGPIYFKTPRKCALFGVCCDAFPTQVNYLCDEACSSSKGANTVISYLHHYFANYGLGERKLVLHADNCWQVLYYFDHMVMLLCALVNFSVTVAETILTVLYESESRSHPRFRKPLVAIMFCSGQNKNNCMMQYLWRVLAGLHDEVEMNFLVAGHTKFSCNLCFGLLKKRYRRTRASSLEDMVNVSA